jgi:hypothetical protein
MPDTSDRTKFLRAIRKCLSDAHGFFQEAMNALDEIGAGSLGTGMVPLVGGYALKDSAKNYRAALIKLDSADKALEPLRKRYRDGRINAEHFREANALLQLKDLVESDYGQLIDLLAKKKAWESVWYRLDELSKKTEELFRQVADE